MGDTYPVRLAFSQVYLMLMKLNRELYECMKSNQARTEELAWSVQLKRLEDNERANQDSYDASRWRGWAQILSAGLTAVASAASAGIGAWRGSAMGGLQMAGHLTPVWDKMPSGVAEQKAASLTKSAEDTRMMVEVLKGHMESIERSGSNDQQDAERLAREAQQLYEAVQRVIMEAERMLAFSA